MTRTRAYLLMIMWVMVFPLLGNAQTNEQKSLEAKRARLQQEIKEINRLLFNEKKEKSNVLDQMEALDKKINVSQELIRVTNQQSNLLNRQINANVRNISKLQKDLEDLKTEYATLIRKSYENRSQQSRVMFLLSSENFFQAFKRFQYMKQYTQYRKKQGEQIVAKTEELAQLNKDLVTQRKQKDQLIAENTKVKNQLSSEKQDQQELLRSIKKNESRYVSEIEAKQKEARKIDQQIEALIRSAIAASNKASGKSTSTNTFALTPEAKQLASNFSANKGKLIWPVEKGVKSTGFGIYADPVYPGIKHQNNGVTIATDKGEQARAIFEGEVIAVLAVPGGNMAVQLKHGNFISTYYNLSNLYVKKGDKVKTKDVLGDIATSKAGKTQLKFYLYQNTTKLNPEEWIYHL